MKKFRGLSPRTNYTDKSGRRRSAKLVPTFADKGCHVVSATGPHGRYSLFSRPEPLLLYSSSSSVNLTRLSGPRSRPTTAQKNLVAPGIEPETSVSVVRNSDHWTTEAVIGFTILILIVVFTPTYAFGLVFQLLPSNILS